MSEAERSNDTTSWLRSPFAATLGAISITMVALVLRLHDLGEESLWSDELATYGFTSRGLLHALSAAARDTGPPLYYLVQSALLRIAPVTEVTLRIIPAVLGAAAVWVVYLVGRRLYSPGVGLLAAGALALAEVPVVQSQEARSYAPAMLFVLLVVWTLLRLAEQPGQLLTLIAHAVAVAAAAYTHLFGLISCLGIGLGVVILPRLRRRLGRSWFVAFGVGLVAWLPWAGVLFLQAKRVAAASSSGQWVLKAPRSIVIEAVKTAERFALWDNSGARWLALVFVLIVLWGLFPAVAIVTKRGRSTDLATSAAGGFQVTLVEASVLVATWLGAVYIGGLLCSKYVIPIFSWRMAGVAAPALYLAAGEGLARAWRPAAIAFVALLLVYSVPGVQTYYAKAQKEDWRSLSTYMVNHDVSNVGLIASPPWMLGNAIRYTEIHGQPERFSDRLGLDRTRDVTAVASAVETYVAGRNEVYVLVGHQSGLRTAGTTVDRALVALGWRPVESRGFNGIWLRLYRPDR